MTGCHIHSQMHLLPGFQTCSLDGGRPSHSHDGGNSAHEGADCKARCEKDERCAYKNSRNHGRSGGTDKRCTTTSAIIYGSNRSASSGGLFLVLVLVLVLVPLSGRATEWACRETSGFTFFNASFAPMESVRSTTTTREPVADTAAARRGRLIRNVPRCCLLVLDCSTLIVDAC